VFDFSLISVFKRLWGRKLGVPHRFLIVAAIAPSVTPHYAQTDRRWDA